MNNFLKIGLAACLGLVMATAANAVPADGRWIRHQQPDGTFVTVRLVGDEHCHAFYNEAGEMMTADADGFLRSAGKVDFGSFYRKQLTKKAPRRAFDLDSEGRTNFPTVGAMNGIIILVEFADNSFQPEYTRELFDSLANGQNYDYDGATGSIAQYFRDQSYGKFQPHYDVVGPVKLDKNLSFYGQNDTQGSDTYAHYMITEACQQADTLFDVDFSKYDNNGDGSVDFVYVIYAGYAESYGAPSNTIWPHQSTLDSYGAAINLDGVTINRYACSEELKNTSGTTLEGIGTFCHEFGHVLGFPDLYQTSGGSGVPLGQWDIMDRGCYNNDSKTPAGYSAWERWTMRWMDLPELDSAAASITLRDIHDEPEAYKLTSPVNRYEYYVIENRQQTSWDAPQAVSGLMIQHIDYNRTSWDNNNVNNDNTHYRVCIVPADNNRGTADYEGDLFPGSTGNTSFTDETTPSSVLYDGTPLGKNLSNIRLNDDGTVSFAFMQKKLVKPEIDEARLTTTPTSLTAAWLPVDGVGSYTLRVKSILPDSIKPAPVDDDFSALDDGNVSSASNRNIGSTLNDFTSETGWTGTELYDAGGWLQLGRYGHSGTLTTPKMHLATADSTFTLKFAAKAFAGRSVNYTLTVVDSLTGTQLYRERLKATSAVDTVFRTFEGGTRSIVVSLSTNHERLFVDFIKVVRGTADSLAIDTIVNPRWTIDGIDATEYTLDGLTPGGTYTWTVQAISGDPLFDSPLSDEQTVTLPDVSDGIDRVDGYGTNATALAADSPVVVYSISGQRLWSGTLSDLRALPVHGVFILQSGKSVRKVVM